MVRSWTLWLVVLGCACGPAVIEPDASGSGTDSSGDSGDAPSTDTGMDTTGAPGAEPIDLYVGRNRRVDFLFVVDDSLSMAQPQRRLVETVPVIVDVFTAADVAVDARIAVTTTDTGHLFCTDETALDGRFVASSCLERLDAFALSGIDASALCVDHCPQPSLALPEPWIAVGDTTTNLSAGATLKDALSCVLPQGIVGCGFESPLEAMRRALDRARDPTSPQYGFLRDTARLAIIFLTDEADCSIRPEHQEAVFSPEGDRVFWSLPDEPLPTSAVCWNAGVMCTGSPDGYDSCDPADKGVGGGPASGADAVAVPVAEYVDEVRAIEAEKLARDPVADVRVSVIAGVPQGLERGAPIPYADGPGGNDPGGFQAQFGIGPGCSNDDDTVAVPPVRLRDFAAAFGEDGAPALTSVCDADYLHAFEPLFDGMRGPLQPACVPVCVRDADAAPGLQPQCTLVERWVDDPGTSLEQAVPECGPDDAVPPGADACFVYLTDATAQTDTPADDMQDYCIDEGVNLELRIVRREGALLPSGAVGTIVCEPSAQPEIDCPALG